MKTHKIKVNESERMLLFEALDELIEKYWSMTGTYSELLADKEEVLEMEKYTQNELIKILKIKDKLRKRHEVYTGLNLFKFSKKRGA